MATGNTAKRAGRGSRDPRYAKITNKIVATRTKIADLTDLMAGYPVEKYLTRSVKKVKREIKCLIKKEKSLIKMRDKIAGSKRK